MVKPKTIDWALCGQCYKKVTAENRKPPDGLGRAMVDHYRSCFYDISRAYADRLEADLDRRAQAENLTSKQVAV